MTEVWESFDWRGKTVLCPPGSRAVLAPYVLDTAHVHSLKTINPYMEQVWRGHKKAELRSTLDRDFTVGDLICLEEWLGEDYGPRIVVARVTSIVTAREISQLFGHIELMPAMLSFEVLVKGKVQGA